MLSVVEQIIHEHVVAFSFFMLRAHHQIAEHSGAQTLDELLRRK